MLIVAYPNRESWLEARRFSIGSSDAAGIMGESSWSSAVQLNYLKRGLIPNVPMAEQRALDLDWHRRREAEIADWWLHRLMPKAEGPAKLPEGLTIWDPGDFAIAYRTVLDDVPLSSTMDRLLLRGPAPSPSEWAERPDGTLSIDIPDANIYADAELKNAHAFMERKWEQEPPLPYILQKQHQMIVSGAPHGYLVASIGGQPPVWAYLRRDGEIISALLAEYLKFWDAVRANENVPADHREVTADAIGMRYPQDDGDTVHLGKDALSWWKTRVQASFAKAAAEKQYDEMTNKLKQDIGDATLAALPEGFTLSLKANKKGHRQLRCISGKDAEENDPNVSYPF